MALQTLAALGGVPQDARLQGNLTRSADGQDQTGSIDLEALGSTRARVVAHLVSGDQVQVRDLSGSAPQGVKTGRDGSRKALALHNLWTAPVWFLPQLSILSEAGQPGVQIEDLGTHTRNGVTVRTLRLTRWHDRVQGAAAPFFRQAAQLSTMEIDLDAATLLPVAMRWFSHPPANLLVNIPEAVEWTDYRKTGNSLIPYHLRRSHNGPLQDDIAITSAVLNAGVPTADFSAAPNRD